MRVQPLLARIGNTPLLRLESFERGLRGVELYAKAEWHNPGGSIKDRTAARIIADATCRGALGGGKILLDATSGNTGVAYAMLAAAYGFRVTLCVPQGLDRTRRGILRRYGARIVVADGVRVARTLDGTLQGLLDGLPGNAVSGGARELLARVRRAGAAVGQLSGTADGTDAAVQEAASLHERFPDRYFYADQYSNPASWRAHYDTTGPEIIEQTSGRCTHFVAAIGTAGTFVGVGRRLRDAAELTGRRVRLIAVHSRSRTRRIPGIRNLDRDLVPGVYDSALADQVIGVTAREAESMARRIHRKTGFPVGPSAGANLAAALRVAESVRRGVIVTIFPDAGLRT